MPNRSGCFYYFFFSCVILSRLFVRLMRKDDVIYTTRQTNSKNKPHEIKNKQNKCYWHTHIHIYTISVIHTSISRKGRRGGGGSCTVSINFVLSSRLGSVFLTMKKRFLDISEILGRIDVCGDEGGLKCCVFHSFSLCFGHACTNKSKWERMIEIHILKKTKFRTYRRIESLLIKLLQDMINIGINL